MLLPPHIDHLAGCRNSPTAEEDCRSYLVKRISLFARDSRDLRERRDWSEVSSLRVAPVAHVLLVSLTIHERRTKRTICSMRRSWRRWSEGICHRYRYFLFRHSHGGTDCGSAHTPFLASRAVFSSPSSTVSLGAFSRYHQHKPRLTSS